jgi:hypothetical protein
VADQPDVSEAGLDFQEPLCADAVDARDLLFVVQVRNIADGGVRADGRG